MATVVNFIDTTLRGADARNLADPSHTFLLACDTPGGFKVGTNGLATPAAIKFSVVRLGLTAAAQFTASDGATVTVDGDTATLTFANMPNGSATVTATITEDGATTTRPFTVSKVYDGAAGSGTTSYTWVKYADSAAGAGLTDDPTGKSYIGLAYNKTTATESTVPSDYAWSLIKGTDGVPGTPGVDGKSLYTWIKYSDNADGSGLYDIPTAATVYIGIAVNKTTATESTNPADYVWSRFKGDQGVPGTGQRGPGWFYWSGNAWSDTAADAATPGDTQIGDQVTISNGTVSYTKRWDGTSWQVPGAYMDGSLFVEKSITAAKINANGLELREPDGTLILGAGSALNLDYAPPGTKNSEIAIGGRNLLRDGSFERGLHTFPESANLSAIQVSSVVGMTDGAKALYVEGTTDFYVYLGTRTAVTPGKTYTISFDYKSATGGVITSSSCFLRTRDAAGSVVSNVAIPLEQFNVQAWARHSQQWTCPAGIYSVELRFGLRTNGASAWIGVDAVKVEEGNAASAYTDAPEDTAADIASAKAAADAANTALNDKLSKTSASSLAATVTLATGGSILAGTTTNGSYMSPSGFYGVQGGVVKFSVPISGDPTFGGQLTAAYGSFGAVSIAAGGSLALQATAYNSDTGIWFGFVGGQPKFSIVAANGAKLLYDPTAATPLQLINATVSNPTLDAFSATISGSAGGSYPNGSYSYGTLTANPSGGKAPYSFNWTLIENNRTGGAGVMTINSTTSQSASFSGSGTNATLEYTVQLIVSDANGRTVTQSRKIVANHGTPP